MSQDAAGPSNYNAVMGALKTAAEDGVQSTESGLSREQQYTLAFAQVHAQLAVADELRALRKAVTEATRDITSAVEGLDSEHSNLRWIQTWLKDIAEKPTDLHGPHGVAD